MNSLSLKAKLAISFTVTAMITMLLGSVVFYSLIQSENDVAIVNVAGRQRMLSQAMSKSALGYSLVKNSLQSAKDQVSELNRYITKMRSTYATRVIGPAKKNGMPISMHPASDVEAALPFPATFTRLVDEKFATGGKLSVDIIAGDPINPKQGLQDGLDRAAFKALLANPDRIYSKAVEQKGKLYLRYYTADKAVVQSCVSCHSKKKAQTYKLGDMLGIRRFTLLFANDIAIGRSRLDPGMQEYKTALKIFTQTLHTFKVGGKYPADLKMTQYKTYAGSTDPEIQSRITTTESILKHFTTTVNQLTSASMGSREYWQAQHDVSTLANKLRQSSGVLTTLFGRVARTIQHTVWLVVTINILSTIMAFLLMFFYLRKSVLIPVEKMAQTASDIAQGDLSQQGSGHHRTDEIGLLSSALDQISGNLNVMIGRIAQASQGLVTTGSEINQATHQVTAGATQQSQQTEMVAEAANAMQVVSNDIAKNTTEAADAANRATQVAQQGGDVVRSSIEGMARITKSVAESAENIELLAQHSGKIDQIVSVINDIANQTNLLALNAAIEAARAGDMGRGFAVVADEVRQLANRTSEATNEITEMIHNIQERTQDAVRSMQEGQDEVTEGSELVAQTGMSLQQIVDVVEELTGQIQQIAVASHQQSVSMAEVTANIDSVSEVSKTARSQAQRSAQSCEEITGLANELQTMVHQFKI